MNCYRGITNPICGECYTKQLSAWLSEIENSLKIIGYIIKKVRGELPSENTNDTFCILCNEKMVCLCTYCFFFNVEKILKESNLPREKIAQFLTAFNYKLYSTRKHAL